MDQDQIHIKDLQFQTIIGVNPEERTTEQAVLINITLFTNLTAAGASDDLADTVNYDSLANAVMGLVKESHFLLVERAAVAVSNLCLASPMVSRAIVTVEKPNAVPFAGAVGVTVDRSRELKGGDHA
jgi:FolB domain-containing protein